MNPAVDDAHVAASAAVRRWKGSVIEDDLFQEALVAAWQSSATWRPGGHPRRSWMRLAARRAVIDQARRWYGRTHRPGFTPLEETHELPAPQHAAAAEWTGPEPDVALSPRQRDVWEGLVRGDRKVEIAADLGISPGRVSELVGEIRTKLAA